MIPVERHIQFLITRFDCVIIPGWGALLAHPVPARIDAAAGIMLPPARIVVFNAAVAHDDGLLISSIARCEHVDYSVAAEAVADYAASLAARVEAEKSVELPRVGRFSRTPEGNVVFEPDDHGVANAPFYGLEPVTLVPLAAAVPAPAAADPIPQSPVVMRVSLGRRVLRVAASVAVLLGLGLTLSTFISNVPGANTHWAGIGTACQSNHDMLRADAQTDQPEEEAIEPIRLTTPADARLLMAIPDPAMSKAPVVAKPAAAATEPAPVATVSAAASTASVTPSSRTYYLIVASLETRAKADRYIRRHQGEGLQLLESDGRYRVFAATGSSVAEASRMKADSSFSARYPDAWVYRARK